MKQLNEKTKKLLFRFLLVFFIVLCIVSFFVSIPIVVGAIWLLIGYILAETRTFMWIKLKKEWRKLRGIEDEQ
jgi:MFS superfamily sulfate permease-like transporter